MPVNSSQVRETKMKYILVITAFFITFAVIRGQRCVCGIQNWDSRIVGGKPVREHRYPWMAKIVAENDFELQDCVGVLISDRYILTASHCFDDNPTQVTVTLGSNSLRKGGFKFNIEKVIIHPYFNSSSLINDIALIELPRRIRFTKNVNPICLPFYQIPKPNYYTVAGWGFTDTRNSESTSDYLIETVIRPFSFKECKNYWQGLTNLQLCAGDIGRDTCQGDSGGPLMQMFRGQMYTMGIVSYGDGTCGTSRNSVYTNVYGYMDWILYNARNSYFCSPHLGYKQK